MTYPDNEIPSWIEHMKYLKIAYDWLVNSSVDPQKTSLTVKAGLTTVVSVLVLASPLVHLKVGDQEFTKVVDDFAQVVFFFLSALSSVLTAFGFVRKIVNTFR